MQRKVSKYFFIRDPETSKFKEKQSSGTKLETYLRSPPDFAVNKNNIGLSEQKPFHYSGNRKSKSSINTTAVLCVFTDTGAEDRPDCSLTSVDWKFK